MHREFYVPALAAAALAALALSAAPALAGIDVEVGLKAKAKGTILPEGEVETFRITALSGSVLNLAASPKKKAPLSLGAELRDPDDLVVALPAGSVDQGKVKARGIALTKTGTYALRIVAEGTGEYALSISGKGPAGSPKPKLRKLDLRGGSLGAPAGGETVLSRIVDETGGTILVDDPTSDLDGAALDIPAGAFDGPTAVTISTSPPAVSTTDDERQASGPSILFGPSGTEFGEAVTVTLPYDLSQVPAGEDPQDLRVLIVEDDGSSTTVDNPVVDEEAGTVTLQTTTFSVCIPISVPGVARIGLTPGGDEYWMLNQFSRMEPDGGNDSRSRLFEMEFGDLSFYGDGSFAYSLENRDISYSDLTDGNTFSSTAEANAGTGTFSYGPDGRSVLLDTGEGSPLAMRVTRNARYMAGRNGSGAETEVSSYLLLRKNTAPLTPASLQGTWNALGMEVSFDGTNSPGPIGIRLHRISGSLALDGAGGARLTAAAKKSEFDSSTGNWSMRSESEGGTASYAVQEDGTILVTTEAEGGDQPDVLRVFPGEGLDTMFLVDDQPCGDCTFFMMLVRQSADFDASQVQGNYRLLNLNVEPDSYGVNGGGFAADLRMQDEEVSLDFAPGGTASGTSDYHSLHRDAGVAGGIAVENDGETFTLPWTVDRKGKFVLQTGDAAAPVGFFAPGGDFGALGTSVSSSSDDYLFGFVLKPPPPQN